MAEDQLLAGDEAQRRHEVAVALARGDPLVLPHRERVRAGRPDRESAVPRGLAHPRPQRAQLLARLGCVRCGLRRDLENRFHELGLDVARLVVSEQGLDRVDEVVRLGVEDHELLLDAEV
jgi:hypothetical protein